MSDNAIISALQLDLVTHFCLPDFTKVGPVSRDINRPVCNFPSIWTPHSASAYSRIRRLLFRPLPSMMSSVDVRFMN